MEQKRFLKEGEQEARFRFCLFFGVVFKSKGNVPCRKKINALYRDGQSMLWSFYVVERMKSRQEGGKDFKKDISNKIQKKNF